MFMLTPHHCGVSIKEFFFHSRIKCSYMKNCSDESQPKKCMWAVYNKIKALPLLKHQNFFLKQDALCIQ